MEDKSYMSIDIDNLAPNWKVKRLLSGRHRVDRPSDHPLKKFFMDRKITLAKLAKVMGVSQGTIFAWMSGHHPPSPPAEIVLNQIREKILAWEQEHQKQFGS